MPKKSLINVKYFKILLLFLFTVSGLNARNAALLYNSNLEKHSYANKELQKWEYLLLKWGINYNLVSLDDFSGSDIDEYSFAIGLALQTASLSELRELSEFAANGGSLILDSSVFGARNAGIIFNDDFWTNNFLMEINEFEKGSSRLVLSFDTPISQNDGGYRFPIRKYNVSFRPTSVNIYSAGFFENTDNQTGLVYGMLEGGKIVWFGIDVDFFSLNNESSGRLKNVVKNSFDWLMGKPQFWVNRLPGNYSSAVAFVCDISSNSPGAFKAVQFFQKENVRPTFVLRPGEKYDKKLLSEFVRTGEIAFNFNDVVSGESAGISGKFYTAIKKFKKINRIKKFRAVKGICLGDVDLLNAIKKEKRVPFEYVIANEKSSNHSYEIFDNGVVRLNFADLNVGGKETYSDILEDVLSRLSLSDNTRDLLGIAFNSSSFLKSGNLFNEFLRDLNERNCWVATLEQIADRLKTRDNISVAFSFLDDDDIEIVIENRNSKTVYDAQILLNEFFGNYQIKNENINGKYYQTDKKLTKLIINKIKSKEKEFIKLHKVNMVVKN